MRTAVVLIVHGRYAGPLLEAARGVAGELPAALVEVLPGVGVEEIRQQVELAVRQAAGPGGDGEVLLLVDICGSTPANCCLALQSDRPGLAVVTGLSLAMLLKVATAAPDLSAAELAGEVQRSAQRSIQLGLDLLHKGAPCGC